MLLGQLQGYDAVTGVYSVEGVADNLPGNPFVVSASTLPSGYDDISSSPEKWHKYGKGLIGTASGFKDWMSLRAIILPLITSICGTNYANFDDLNAEQKIIALHYFPTKIVTSQGFPFFVTKSGGTANAFSYVENYLNLSEIARSNRYINYMNFGYQYLGTPQGLKAESFLRAAFLDTTYIKRGVLFTAEDGIDGLGDWTNNTGSFTTNGLKARIENEEFVLGPGITLQSFIDTLTNILVDGAY
jgi:hypothetical protein